MRKGFVDENGNRTRSGLYEEFIRLIDEIRPRYVVLENVGELIRERYLLAVLGALAEIGYDAEWETFHAYEFGFPHRRKRVFIVAYPVRDADRNGRVFAFSKIEKKYRDDAAKKCSEFLRRYILAPPWYATVERSLRMHDGLSSEMERIELLGNAIVPQIAELIFKSIMECDNAPDKLIASRN